MSAIEMMAMKRTGAKCVFNVFFAVIQDGTHTLCWVGTMYAVYADEGISIT